MTHITSSAACCLFDLFTYLLLSYMYFWAIRPPSAFNACWSHSVICSSVQRAFLSAHKNKNSFVIFIFYLFNSNETQTSTMKLLLLASAAVLIANDAHAQDTTSTTTTHIRGSVHTNENVSNEVILWPNICMSYQFCVLLTSDNAHIINTDTNPNPRLTSPNWIRKK